MSYTAKSVILDIAGNWGYFDYVGLRSVDFWYEGSKITNLASDFTPYATTEYSSTYHAENVFDTSISKTGAFSNNVWLSSAGVNTNQRIICVFDNSITFDEIRINNVHNSGGLTTAGAKNVKINISTDSITDTPYNASITNSTEIYDGEFDEHVASDVEDEQILTLTSSITDLTSTNIETSPAIISSPSSIPENQKYNKFKKWGTSSFYWKTRPSNRWKNYTATIIEIGFPVLLITELYGDRPTPTDIVNLDYGLKLAGDWEEQFGLKLAGEFNEDYHITQNIVQEIEETYGIKLTLDYMEWYSDAPVRKKTFNEYYDDARIVKRAIVLRYKDSSIPILLTNEMYSNIPYVAAVIWEIYKDAPQAIKALEEKYSDVRQNKTSVILRYNDSLAAKSYIVETYDTAKALKLITCEKYSISGNQVQQTYPESYNIESLNKISKPFDEKYYILPDSPAASTVNVSVTIDGIEIDFIGLDIDISIDKYAILGSIQLATEEDYLFCKYMSEIVCEIEGETFNFFLENKTKTTEHSSGVVYTIEMVSPTVKLDAPYSSSIIESFPDGIYAETLVNQMAAIQGIAVDYQILDWFIPGYAISINDETPLSVIRRVVNSAGAVLQTKPDGTLLIISKYEVSPKDWKDYEATEIVSSTDSITYFTESLQINDGYNAFLVTDQGSSSSNITLREVNVDSNTKIIRGFRIPFTDGEFSLLTSGGDLVTIDKDVDPIEENVPIADLEGEVTEEWEYVEFIDWVGRTSYPIYELIDSDWEEDDLGAFQISEDGTLTIINQESVPSESLLRIKYKTKYWKWTVTGVEGKHVQFYVPEEEE